jgi:hypothetical protein
MMNEAPMSRRQALACCAGIVGMIGFGAGVPAHPRQAYVCAGHLTPDSPAALSVSHVTLDGQRVDHVTECDDVEGWLVRLVEVGPDALRTERLTGVVRVYWERAV